MKAQNLLATVQKYPSFPIVMETYRQALADVFDMTALKSLLKDVRSRTIQVDDVETRSASPFARSLVFAYVAAYLYEQDAPLAERKAQALTLDRGLLAELLGQTELRDLIDIDVLEELEDDLQFRSETYRARDPDELHDVLRRVGDLDRDELALRASDDPSPWIDELIAARQALDVAVAGQRRLIAAEDAGLYRDALGVMPPSGVPDAFLQPVEDALLRLLRRYARHRGPFLAHEPAERFGLRSAQVVPALDVLIASGELVRGEIRPGGAEPEFCDTDVLRRLKRRNLAKLRDDVAAVDGAAMALFLPRWHGVFEGRQGMLRLREALSQLQGLPLSWNLLDGTILPSRVAGYTSAMLDTLAASGELVWIGAGRSGKSDGRIAVFLRESARDLIPYPDDYAPPSPVHAEVLGCLDDRGASFMMEIQDWMDDELPDTPSTEIIAAVWDLVWDGQVTNDTFAPLKGLGRTSSRRRSSQLRSSSPSTGGRWSLVRQLARKKTNVTRHTIARARLLLERYGVVNRSVAAAEGVPGGWSTLYKVYRELEEQGQVRRGHFVDGLSGAQFALSGAIDRLRSCRDEAEDRDSTASADDVLILPASDPANPYGAQLPWPEPGNPDLAAPRRVSGAFVILVRGVPALYAARNGRVLLSFPLGLRKTPGALDVAIRALFRLPRTGRSKLTVVEKIDGVNVLESPFLEDFRNAGFGTDYRGLVDVRPPGSETKDAVNRRA
jgi:ATP-dependent Lhr-like helicase